MTMLAMFSGLAAFALAFANGANDNCKGVATLIGCGRLSPRVALIFAAALTFLGSIAALLLAGELVRTFSGEGVIASDVIFTAQFPLCIGIAASAAVLLATRLGIPVSTTHALIGSFVGVGLASEIIWTGIWKSFAYPLLAAPLLAAVITIPLYLTFRWTRRRLGVVRESCLCVQRARCEPAIDASDSSDGRAVALKTLDSPVRVTVGHFPDCRAGLHGTVIGLDAQRVLDGAHIFTAGAVSFARGLNDTPKIAAILLIAFAGAGAGMEAGVRSIPGSEKLWPIIAVAIGMAAGGLLAAKRVAHTMSRRITDMNDGQAFTANLVTAGLVIFASTLGVPASTTHVSCGSLFGIGIANRTARWKMITTILLAWITTLPLAGLIGYLMWEMMSSW